MPDVPQMGLAARVLNVIFAPRQAYAAVAARPRALGVLLVVIAVMSLGQSIFLSTDVGKNAAYDQQMSALKAFGVTVTDQMATQLESRMASAQYTAPISTAVFIVIFVAVLAGVVLAIFTVITGGGATYKQMFAVVAHSAVIAAVQQIFSLPIMYAKGEMTSPTRFSVFLPMLGEDGFAYHLMSAFDLFYFWSTINLAIGVAVLYKRPTFGVAAVLVGIYVVMAFIYAGFRAF
jgi:hypothetical protein